MLKEAKQYSIDQSKFRSRVANRSLPWSINKILIALPTADNLNQHLRQFVMTWMAWGIFFNYFFVSFFFLGRSEGSNCSKSARLVSSVSSRWSVSSAMISTTTCLSNSLDRCQQDHLAMLIWRGFVRFSVCVLFMANDLWFLAWEREGQRDRILAESNNDNDIQDGKRVRLFGFVEWSACSTADVHQFRRHRIHWSLHVLWALFRYKFMLGCCAVRLHLSVIASPQPPIFKMSNSQTVPCRQQAEMINSIDWFSSSRR